MSFFHTKSVAQLQSDAENSKLSKNLSVFDLTFLGVGGIIGAGVFVLTEYRAEVVGLGALGMLLGVAGLAPVIGRPVTWTLGRLFRGVFGIQGKLADLNTAELAAGRPEVEPPLFDSIVADLLAEGFFREENDTLTP